MLPKPPELPEKQKPFPEYDHLLELHAQIMSVILNEEILEKHRMNRLSKVINNMEVVNYLNN